MIETLPLLPAVATPARGPSTDAGQADFGQWLAPPPAATGQPALPLAPPVGNVIGEAGRGAGPTLPLPGVGLDLIMPSLPTAPRPVVVHLALPVSPTPAAPVAALVALPTGGDVGPVWTLASRSGGEAVELFFSPWQLVAGYRLSQQGRSPLPGLAPTGALAGGAAGMAGTPAAAGAAAKAALGDGAALPRVAALAPVMAWATAAQQSAAGSATAEALGSGQPALGAAAAWPLRLLRWLNEGPHGATAWLRDFTLESDALPALVDDLRHFAADQDMALHRIVLNGRTLWTSAPPLDSPP